MNSGSRTWRVILLVAVAISSLAPLVYLTTASIASSWFYPAVLPSRWSGQGWSDLLGGANSLRSGLGMSLLLAVLTGMGAAALGWPLGRALASVSGWRRHVGAAAAFLPVAAPPIALATGLQVSLLGLGLAGRPAGVLLAHLTPAAGYVALYYLGVFSAFDARIEDEARTLGATRWVVLTHVTLPMLRGPLLEAALLGFLISWAQVALTLVVGRGQVRTLPLELFALLQAGQDRLAAVGALMLLVPPLLLLGAVHLAVARGKVAPL